MMDYVLKMIDYTLKPMDYIPKRMDYILKIMNSAALSARLRVSTRPPRHLNSL